MPRYEPVATRPPPPPPGLHRRPPNPPRVPPADRWSPYEIALFEAAICLAGKMFDQIATAVRTKSAAECIEFYYLWKASKNYAVWKAAYRPASGDDAEDD